MIKMWADSLDKNFQNPNESFLFVKDLVTYGEGLEWAASAAQSDCIVIPQYSNNHINNSVGNYVFDKEKADYLFHLGKPVVIVNTGGGSPIEWQDFPIWEYISGDYTKVIMFSTESYSWHRNHLPKSLVYAPFDYVGFVDFGLGIRKIPTIQTKDEFLKRTFDTCYVMNTYPPTRNVIWDMVHENKWKHFSYQTIPEGDQTRISWEDMLHKMYSSKVTFVPDGATAKTERHIFSPCYAAIAKSEDRYLEYAFPWVDGINCIEMAHDFKDGLHKEKELSYNKNGHQLRILNKEKTSQKIIEYLSNPEKIYDIYVQGWLNDERYRIPNYNKNHIGKTIKENI